MTAYRDMTYCTATCRRNRPGACERAFSYQQWLNRAVDGPEPEPLWLADLRRECRKFERRE